uniref:Uncharacterized protein n=1 Tax=Trichinella nativa TaxID=6335 RepID=A0A0V1KHT9_9BILA
MPKLMGHNEGNPKRKTHCPESSRTKGSKFTQEE